MLVLKIILKYFALCVTFNILLFIESGEGDKLNGEPLRKDAETMISLERLHIITRFNPLGSLHSLSRGSRARVSFSLYTVLKFNINRDN